jgi:arsenate reductase
VFDILRGREAKSLGLTMDESEDEIIALMAQNPKLMQRPIGVVGERAVLGRPHDALLTLL